MTSLNWSDSYNVNVEAIDVQHREMADLVEKLHLAIAAGADPDSLKPIVRSLLDHTRDHFALEEGLMDQHGYPKTRLHKSEHANLLRQLEIVQQALAEGRIPSFCHNMDISADWIMVHVAHSDSELGRFINSRQA